MEFKGTKGEWVLAETPTVNCKSIKTESGEYVGMLSLNVVRPALMSEQKLINEANAKLIACAPEMLDALIHIQDYVTRSLTLSGHTKEQIDFILRRVNPVIIKATE